MIEMVTQCRYMNSMGQIIERPLACQERQAMRDNQPEGAVEIPGEVEPETVNIENCGELA